MEADEGGCISLWHQKGVVEAHAWTGAGHPRGMVHSKPPALGSSPSSALGCCETAGFMEAIIGAQLEVMTNAAA